MWNGYDDYAGYNHAKVKIGGMVIPLIGIPVSATEYECDLCHEIFEVEDLMLNSAGNQFLCPKHVDNLSDK
jgi:hypothetical protein